MLITFEGIEGCGKTTQLDMLLDHLRKKGMDVMAVREPGGTALGEKVRAILLNRHGGGEKEGISHWSELFLYEACRAQLVSRVIAPALEDGRIVLCDRFTDSTVAYQGYGRGLPLDAVTSINGWAAQGIRQDLTFLIDCPVEVGLGRAWSRIESGGAAPGEREDRFEREEIEFHERVRRGYLEMAAKEPERIRLIDGSREIPDIHREICDIIDGMMG